jgi:hypothetical protein
VSNWNFGIQRELGRTMIAEVAYVGNKITHLFWNRQDNANNPLLLEQWGQRLLDVVPNPYFGKVTTGTLSFPTVQRRQLLRPFPHYQDVLHIRANYGDSSYQSISSIGGDSNTWVVGPSNALYNPKYNRGLEANDLPHRLVLSFLYELPFGKGFSRANSGLASYILGGWQFNGITIFQSGRPILITAPDDTNLFNFQYTNGRADRLKSGVLESGQTLDRWFDTTAFRRARPFTVPTDSLTQPDLRGPGRTSLDVSVFKNTRIGERYNIQFRAEAFNLTNTPFFEARGTTTDVTNQDFGRITSGSMPRNIQFGIRVLF